MPAAVKESLSIEETNKIRVSLGLKPLPTGNDSAASKATGGGDDSAAGPPADPDAAAEANYAARRATEARERSEADLRARLDKSRNRRELAAKLKGRGLGAAAGGKGEGGEVEEGEEEDVRSWVRKQKKRSKALAAEAARKERALAEQEGLASYGERDLEGLKVGHNLDELEQGEDVILTLKDSRILDGEDDELHNINLAEAAKSKAALELKKLGRQAGQYTGYDDDEFVDPGKARGVLGKYDEVIDGKEEKSFRLGAATASFAAAGGDGMEGEQLGLAARAAKKAATAEELKKNLLSLDYTKNFESDYLQEGDKGFKKPKKSKKKARSSRKATVDEELTLPTPTGPDSMDIEGAPPAPEDGAVVDDDEVQQVMSRMRREAGKMRQKKQLRLTAADIARRREEAATAGPDGVVVKMEEDGDGVKAEEDTEEDEEGKAIVLDDTSEFIQNMARHQERLTAQARASARKEGPDRPVSPPAAPSFPRVKSEPQDVVLSEFNGDGSGNGDITMGDGDDSDEDITEEEARVRLMEIDEASSKAPLQGTGDEQYVAGGLAATLSLLKQQGLIKPMTEEDRLREKLYKDKQVWIIEQRRRDALREWEREQSRRAGSSKDQAQREYENRQREAQAAKESLEAFRHYKPVVEIKYNDEFGRELSAKEAWKMLSHKFHGKGSGKTKTEKRIKKIEEEKKKLAMASGDTPTGTSEAFRKRQEKLGSATMVLSVGNKGTAPQQEALLGSISKPGAEKKGKGKAKDKASGGQQAKGSPAPDLMNGLGVASGPPGARGRDAASPMMAPRKAAGFKPIAAQATPQGGSETPGGERSGSRGGTPKISIGLGGGTKRKAEEEATGSPEAKRVA